MFGLIRHPNGTIAAVRLADQAVRICDTMGQASAFISAGYTVQQLNEADYNKAIEHSAGVRF